MPAEKRDRRIDYNQKKESGFCPRCGARMGKRENYTYCSSCREFFRNYNKARADLINETRKIRYDERKENGQCPRCGKTLGKRYKNIICEACLEKQYSYVN